MLRESVFTGLDWTGLLDWTLTPTFFYLNLNLVVHGSLCTAGAAQADAELSIKLV